MALEGYEKHSVFTYAILGGLRKANYNKNLKIGIGDLADYGENLVLALTWKNTGLRSIPMPDLPGISFPIGTKS